MNNAEINEQQIRDIIEEQLISCGIHPMHLGYKYILGAVVKIIDDESMALCVTKRLYPYLAELYCTTSQAVERNIRTAINAACRKENENLKHFMGVEHGNLRITNKEFIFKTVNLIKKYSEISNYDEY